MADNQNKGIKEKRKYVRLQTVVEVNYTIIGKPGAINVFSKNISAGGLCLVMQNKLSVNTPLQLSMKIPDLKNPIPALGKVVWQKEVQDTKDKSKTYFDTGVEFTGISDFERFNINRYVMEHIVL